MKHIYELQLKYNLPTSGVLDTNTIIAIKDNLFDGNKVRTAHFLGQIAHESGDFKFVKENLNYSAEGLLKTFPKYFKTIEDARKAERKPEIIANKVYSNRMGNGVNDGFKFIGRGALQLTGKTNYTLFSKHIKDNSILDNPELLETKYYFESALWFFTYNRLLALCDKGINVKTITELTQRINGGKHGLEDRIAKTKKYYEILMK